MSEFALGFPIQVSDEPVPVVTLEQLSARLAIVEAMPIAFDLQLRQNLWWSGAGLAAALILATIGAPLLLLLYVPTAIVWGVTAMLTNGFQAGQIVWHRIGMALCVVGIPSLVIAAVIAFVAVIGAVIAALAGVLFVFALFGAMAAAAR